MPSDQPHYPQPETQFPSPHQSISAPQLSSPPQNPTQQPSTTLQIRTDGPTAEATPETSRKRARPTVSCFECRRKKLKCDRVQPCDQCLKGRREALCQFAAEVPRSGASRAPPHAGENGGGEWDAKRPRLDERTPGSIMVGNGRVNDLGRRDEGASAAQTSTLGRIYVKGNRSRYLGIGDRMAMLDHFEDARNYIMSCFKDPETRGMMQELTFYQNSFQRKFKKPRAEPSQDRSSLIVEMLKSLPADNSFNTFYRLYEMHWEGFTRVMHMETFLKESEGLQDFVFSQGPTGNYSLPPGIRESLIPQMIGVLALSARLINDLSKRVTEDQIGNWAGMIQRWLDALRGKERLNLQTLRIQILLLLIKMNNLAQMSDLWKESGTLVRSAMIVGLHQDPENYQEISLYEKEQRRKLWRTIIELDIQFSLASGMPAAIRSLDFNSQPLRNVNDIALKEDMAIYPESKAERLWTDASPQVILNASIKERLDATNILAGHVNPGEDAEKLLRLARFFEYSLQDLPIPPRTEEVWGQRNERSAGKFFLKIMLDVKLRQPCLCIYQHIMLSDWGGRYREARKGAVRNAITMLNHLDALNPEVADPNIIKNRDQLNLFHVLCKKDIIQAALILCLEIRSLREEEGRVNGVQILQDEMLPWTKISLTRIVENTLNSLLQRLGEFGSDLKYILPIIVVLQSARSDGTPEDKKLLMRKGTERMLKACRDSLPQMAVTPAASHDENAQTPSSNTGTQPGPAILALPQVSNSHEPLGPKNGFVDFNMLPTTDLAFQDFDFGFADWGDMNESWF